MYTNNKTTCKVLCSLLLHVPELPVSIGSECSRWIMGDVVKINGKGKSLSDNLTDITII